MCILALAVVYTLGSVAALVAAAAYIPGPPVYLEALEAVCILGSAASAMAAYTLEVEELPTLYSVSGRLMSHTLDRRMLLASALCYSLDTAL